MQKSVDNFELERKTCKILVGVQFPHKVSSWCNLFFIWYVYIMLLGQICALEDNFFNANDDDTVSHVICGFSVDILKKLAYKIISRYLLLKSNRTDGVRTTRHIYKLAPNIQTCPIVKSPQFKLAPNTNSPHFLCMVSTVRAWFVLVVFYHRSNVYPALQVMVLVNKRRDRSMLCVLSHVNNAIELYWSLIVERYSKALRAYSGWPGCIEVLLLSIIIFVF